MISAKSFGERRRNVSLPIAARKSKLERISFRAVYHSWAVRVSSAQVARFVLFGFQTFRRRGKDSLKINKTFRFSSLRFCRLRSKIFWKDFDCFAYISRAVFTIIHFVCVSIRKLTQSRRRRLSCFIELSALALCAHHKRFKLFAYQTCINNSFLSSSSTNRRLPFMRVTFSIGSYRSLLRLE